MLLATPADCPALRADSRPAPSALSWAVDVALLAAYWALAAATIALYHRVRHLPQFKIRSMPVLLISTLGYGLIFCVLPLWHLVLPDFPCALYAVFWPIGTALQAGSSCTRLLVLLLQSRVQQTTSKMANTFERSGSVHSNTSAEMSMNSSNRRKALGQYPFFALLGSLAFKTSSRVESGKEATAQTLADALLVQKHAVELRSLLMMTLFMCIPALIGICALLAAHPVYSSLNCSGCDMYGEMLAVVLVVYSVLLILRLRIARAIRAQGIVDPYGLVTEVRINAVIYLTFTIPAIVLFVVDPQYLDFNRQLSWLWLIAVAILIVYGNEYTRHGWVAYMELRRAEALGASAPAEKRVEISRILENDIIANRFEKFATENFCGEAAKFLRDARHFKTWTEGRPKDVVQAKAKALSRLYIAQNSLLQVNISARSRSAIESRVERGDVSPDMFREAEVELLNLIKASLWGQFRASGGLEGLQDTANARSPGKPQLTSVASASTMTTDSSVVIPAQMNETEEV